jgi:hypothetical protein
MAEAPVGLGTVTNNHHPLSGGCGRMIGAGIVTGLEASVLYTIGSCT